ncbi:MAG: CPBP family intramembrane glutamic endopeptidase [Pseudomonadota bacterium]
MADGVELGEARILAPGKWRWLRAVAWMAVLVVLAIATFNVAADATLRIAAWMHGSTFTTRAAAPDGARLAAIIVGSVAMLFTYAIAVRLGERRAPSELRLAPFLAEVGAGFAIGGLLIAAIIGLLVVGGWATVEPSTIGRIMPALKEMVQSAAIEETLFRIILLRLLWRAFGVWPALATSAILFGAMHLSNPGGTPFGAACLIAGEGVSIGLYMLSGRLWLSIGMHAGWNFTQGWIFGSVVSGYALFAGGPLVTRPVAGLADVLSGGAFGPESTLASLLISLTASAATLWIAWSKGRFTRSAEIAAAGAPS